MNLINKLLSRIKENFKKNKVLFIVLSIIWIIVVVITLSINNHILGKEPVGNEDFSQTFELKKNMVFEQSLPVEDGSKNISIKYATYIRNNKGNIFITVTGKETGKEYLKTKTNVKLLQDNSYVTYELNEVLNKEVDKNVIIELSSDSEKGSCAGIYYATNGYFAGSSLKVNGLKTSAELAAKYLIDNDTYLVFSNTVITCVIVALSLIIVLLLLFEPKMEILITTMVIVFGLIFACIMSPGAIPDENQHYEVSLQISNIMMGKKNNEIDKEYANYDSFGSFINAHYSYNRFMRDMSKPLKLKGEMYYLQERENDIYKHYYLPYYVPQAIGVTLARLFNVNTLRTYYSGRVFNLLFYAACVFVAIKNTPIHKLLFGLISCFPIFIQQAASFSYDGFINGLTLISIAYLLKWLFTDKTISNKDIIIVFITSLALAPAKIVYGIFALLFWLVPNEKFGSKKRKIFASLLISLPAISIIAVNIWWRIESSISNILGINLVHADSFDVSDVLSEEELGYELKGGYTYSTSFILHNPVQTISIIYRTVRFWLSTWFYQSIGKALAGVTLILPMAYIRLILILVIAAVFRKEDYHISPLIKISFAVVCLMMAMFIILGMLYGWTLTTDTMIQGIQGRYFCPLLPFFFAIFTNSKFNLPKKIDKYVIYSYVLIMFEIIIYVLSYTFVN